MTAAAVQGHDNSGVALADEREGVGRAFRQPPPNNPDGSIQLLVT